MAEIVTYKPDFIGIGSPQCATSWVYKNLKEHPEVQPARHKEITYWTCEEERFQKMVYGDFFNPVSGKITGEFDPQCMYIPMAPHRMKAAYGDEPPKLIAILRNPVERTWSNFNRINKGKDLGHTFYEYAVLAHGKKREDHWKRNVYGSIERSFYYEQLSRYYEEFSGHYIKVMLYEDLCEDPLFFMNELAEYLGISYYTELPEPNRVNVNKKDEMPDEIRSLLKAVFEEDINRTQKLTGINLDIWRQ